MELQTSFSEAAELPPPLSTLKMCPPMTTEIGSAKTLSRDAIDVNEDSGLSSISGSSHSNSTMGTVCKKEPNELTIGEGISFVDPEIIEKMRLKEARKREESEQKAEQRRAQEAYEQEVQEKQYKCLMHLLTKSKALSTFLTEKVKGPSQKPNDNANKSGAKRKGAQVKTAPVPKKKGRPRKSVNLSEEDISEELALMSDEDEKESDEKVLESFVTSKYFEGELRDYQKIGVNWLKALYEHGLNGILADEMGLGKTIQVIALFAYLIEKRIAGPYMIIIPLSTLPNWISEFERFAPELPIVVYYGNAEQRMALKNKINKKYRVGETFSTQPIVIMTYQMPLNEKHFLSQFNWKYIVIDEAQRIKNFDCQLFRIVKSFKSVNRLLLTGTPLQNNLAELWSLLNFLLPDIFNDVDVFESWFEAKQVQNAEGQKKFLKQEQEKQVMSALRQILKPFMLRRLKEEVCPDIPPLKEVVVHAPMTTFQYDIYSAILKRDLAKFNVHEMDVVKFDLDGPRPKRKCANKQIYDVDGRLIFRKSYDNSSKLSIKPSEDKTIQEQELSIWSKFTKITNENIEFLSRLKLTNKFMLYRHIVNHPYLIHRPLNDCGMYLVDENLIKVSGKLLVLNAMLKKLKSKGHKILFFSTMTMVLDMIEDYLSMRSYQYVRLDGGVKIDDRREAIDSFQTDPEVFMFLLTTKAGAVGLNLAAADTVIIYDSDWNPQNDLQAMARCHRIGQTKPVVVYRLCTKGSVDEEIIKRANTKRFLEKAVISKEGNLINTEGGLLKLKLLLDENVKIADPKQEVYTEAELEDLLDRSDMVPAQIEQSENIN